MITDLYQKYVDDPATYYKAQYEHTVPNNEWEARSRDAADNFLAIAGSSIYDDDVVADFGSRTGDTAYHIFSKTGIKPLCVDMFKEYLTDSATRGLPIKAANIEDMHDLADNSVQWGFCSHTIEHVMDLDKAASELTRVVQYGLYLVFPLENDRQTSKNPAHIHYSTDPEYFIKPFEDKGWKRGVVVGTQEGRMDFQVWLHK